MLSSEQIKSYSQPTPNVMSVSIPAVMDLKFNAPAFNEFCTVDGDFEEVVDFVVAAEVTDFVVEVVVFVVDADLTVGLVVVVAVAVVDDAVVFAMDLVVDLVVDVVDLVVDVVVVDFVVVFSFLVV